MTEARMPDYEIRPNEGVGPITFGMTVDEVRRALGPPDAVFRKWSSPFPTDDFRRLGFHVYYSAEGVCNAVEFFPPGNPVLRGHAFLSKPFSTVRDTLLILDPEAKSDQAGMKSRAIGIGVYAPHATKSPDDPVEGVIVFAKDHYGG
jgi:hypothetical protein